jgi:hypothetical protein
VTFISEEPVAWTRRDGSGLEGVATALRAVFGSGDEGAPNEAVVVGVAVSGELRTAEGCRTELLVVWDAAPADGWGLIVASCGWAGLARGRAREFFGWAPPTDRRQSITAEICV